VGITRRIAKVLAVATASVVSATLVSGTSPAHALDHYTVDNDPLLLTENAAHFDGQVTSFHDGAHLRATLTGTVRSFDNNACVTIGIRFTYHDGTKDPVFIDATNACGIVARAASVDSNPNKDVVRYEYQTLTMPNAGPITAGPVHQDFVGDPPESTGTCERIDVDPASTVNTADFPTFSGNTVYGCRTDNGTTIAAVSGLLDGSNIRLPEGWMTVTFMYADGTSHAVSSPSVSSSQRTRTLVMTSDQSKDVRHVTVAVFAGGPTAKTRSGPSTSDYFGDL